MPDHKPTKEELDAHSVKEALDVQPKRKAWTPEEEAIWHELVIKCLDQHLVPMVRADGRIKGRHLLSHKNATIGKLKSSK